jgi:hypothetical protein
MQYCAHTRTQMKVFLSYRRSDSAGQAGRLHDALVARFGDGAVFHDVSSIDAGDDFVRALTAAVADSDVMLVVIGPRWAAPGPGGAAERLRDPQDFVRVEVGTALALGKRLIPVLVGGATLPDATALPEELRPLTRRQAIELRDSSWRSDVEALQQSLTGERSESKRAPSRGFVGASLALAAIALVALAVWQPWSGESTDGSEEGVLPVCHPPLEDGAGWQALSLVDNASGVSEESLFEAQQAGYRTLANDQWLLVVRMRMTNQSADLLYHAYWRYDGMVVDGLLYPLSCFNTILGGELTAPGLSSEGFIGVEVPRQPRGQVEIAVRPRFVISAPQ